MRSSRRRREIAKGKEEAWAVSGTDTFIFAARQPLRDHSCFMG